MTDVLCVVAMWCREPYCEANLFIATSFVVVYTILEYVIYYFYSTATSFTVVYICRVSHLSFLIYCKLIYCKLIYWFILQVHVVFSIAIHIVHSSSSS